MIPKVFGCAVACLILMAGAFAQQRKQSEIDLQAAIRIETVDGEITTAIDKYKAIVEKYVKTDRATTALALLQLAEAYDKVGATEARATLERLLSEFPEQPPAVRARALLARTVPRAAESGAPLCKDCFGPYFHGFTLSPDRRFIGYTDAKNDLLMRDLSNGTVRQLVTFPTDSSSSERFRARRAVWSPDMRKIAFFVRDTDAPGTIKDRAQLRVMDSLTGSDSTVLVDNPEYVYVFPYAWSPDSKSILVATQLRDFTWQLAWVSAVNGAVKVLRSLDWQFDEFRNGPELSADGQYIVYATYAARRSSAIDRMGIERALHVLASNGSSDVILPANASGLTSPIWSADGSEILFLSDRDGSGSYDLWRMPIRNGKSAGLATLVRSSIGTTQMSPALLGMTTTGRLYYLLPQSASKRIFIHALSSAPTTVAGVTTSFGGYNPSWSPDGTAIAWIKNPANPVQLSGEGPFQLARVVVHVQDGRDQIYSLGERTNVLNLFWSGDGSNVFATLVDQQSGRGFGVAQIDRANGSVRRIGTYQPGANETWDKAAAIVSPSDTSAYLLRWPVASRQGPAQVMHLDLVTSQTDRVLAELTSPLSLQADAFASIGQKMETTRFASTIVGVSPSPYGTALAVISMPNSKSCSLLTVTLDNRREVYGPVPTLSNGNRAATCRISDVKWLKGGNAVAFALEQDDLSWKFMRLDLRDLRTEPLGGLDRESLRFDISPNGQHVAEQRLMTFDGELWAIELPGQNAR
jgi:Tol biopolymer transport system component